MKLLVLGSGAREAVFVWSFLQSEHEVLAAPGNPGMVALGAKCFPHYDVTNIEGLLELVRDQEVNLTVVGPELPLSLGIVDRFREDGRAIVGPTKKAAQLETSKAWAKEFMKRHHIPTAAYDICDTVEQAQAAAIKRNGDCAVKADGLAEGKAVTVCSTMAEAEAAIHKMMVAKAFKDAGNRLVIEDKLKGVECSFIAVSDGVHVVPFRKARDWKRRYDGDRGDNTGGVGGQCPVFENDPTLDQRIMDTIMMPVIKGMAEEGIPFTGFLYVGLMLTADGPKVIEFNVRMGDPEASVILPMNQDDLALALRASTIPGGLRNGKFHWLDGVCVCVVMVSDGYPGKYEKGFPITGIHEAEYEANCLVFHANTAKQNGQLVTAGGRVLDVVGWGLTLEEARHKAYNGVRLINFQGCDYRHDIAGS